MAPSGGRPSSRLSERQLVGLFSLGLGVVLFLLILVRGQQAAREGNQEIRNDTYWVLVSPLVFSAFGIALLRAPKGRPPSGSSRRGGAPVVMRPQVNRALEQSSSTARSAEASLARVEAETRQQLARAHGEVAEALATVRHLEAERDRTAAQTADRIQALERELAQVRQASIALDADLKRSLVTQTSDTSGALAAVQMVEGRVDQLAGGLNGQLAGARRQLDQLIASQEEQLTRLRGEASQARLKLDQLSADQDAQLARVRAEALQSAEASLHALKSEREQAVADATARFSVVEAELARVQHACGQLEHDLRGSIFRPGSEGSVPEAAVAAVTGQVDQLGAGVADQLRLARQRIDQMIATQEDQFSRLRAEAADAKAALERLRSEHEADMVRVRAQADAVVQSSLQALDGERGRLAAEASARIGSLEQELSRVKEAWDQLEGDLRQSLLSPMADGAVPLALVRQVEGRVDGLAAGLRDQFERAQRSLEPLLAGQDDHLSRMRLEASELRVSFDQLSVDLDAQLARVRAEATAAIQAAQAAQIQSQAVADTVPQQIATMDQRIQQAQQSCTRAEATLAAAVESTGKVQADARASAEQAQRRVDELAGSLAAQMDQARQQLAAALQASQEAQGLVDRLEQAAFAAPVSQEAWSTAAVDPFLSCYREACEELGVLPGSSWQEVRATWRRNLMQWHPDQGGDSRLWSRRSAAYQLLVAWYEFNGAS